ncbi:hypothetical protein CBF45_14665 [Bordetella sp. J329]|nr:hypothetical protein CBF45_14665 [Bordetella sp. J329]
MAIPLHGQVCLRERMVAWAASLRRQPAPLAVTGAASVAAPAGGRVNAPQVAWATRSSGIVKNRYSV